MNPFAYAPDGRSSRRSLSISSRKAWRTSVPRATASSEMRRRSRSARNAAPKPVRIACPVEVIRLEARDYRGMEARRQPGFLVLEGMDGTGTTTIADLVSERLRARDLRVCLT